MPITSKKLILCFEIGLSLLGMLRKAWPISKLSIFYESN